MCSSPIAPYMHTYFYPIRLITAMLWLGWAVTLNAQMLGPRQPPSPEEQRRMRTRAEEELQNAGSDTARVRLKMQIAGLTAPENFAEALTLAKDALALAEKTKHPETIARARFGLANIYQRNNRLDDALQHLNEGLPLAEKLGIAQVLEGYHNQLGRIYLERGMYEKALLHYQKSLEGLEKTSAPPFRKAGVLNQIGMILLNSGKHREAAGFLEQAGALAEHARAWDMADGIWNNLANCHDALNEPREAEDAREKSRACAEYNKKKALAHPPKKSGNN